MYTLRIGLPQFRRPVGDAGGNVGVVHAGQPGTIRAHPPEGVVARPLCVAGRAGIGGVGAGANAGCGLGSRADSAGRALACCRRGVGAVGEGEGFGGGL